MSTKKVYTRIVLDMNLLDIPIIESESFDYDGDWALCDEGSSGDGGTGSGMSGTAAGESAAAAFGAIGHTGSYGGDQSALGYAMHGGMDGNATVDSEGNYSTEPGAISYSAYAAQKAAEAAAAAPAGTSFSSMADGTSASNATGNESAPDTANFSVSTPASPVDQATMAQGYQSLGLGTDAPTPEVGTLSTQALRDAALSYAKTGIAGSPESSAPTGNESAPATANVGDMAALVASMYSPSVVASLQNARQATAYAGTHDDSSDPVSFSPNYNLANFHAYAGLAPGSAESSAANVGSMSAIGDAADSMNSARKTMAGYFGTALGWGANALGMTDNVQGVTPAAYNNALNSSMDLGSLANAVQSGTVASTPQGQVTNSLPGWAANIGSFALGLGSFQGLSSLPNVASQAVNMAKNAQFSASLGRSGDSQSPGGENNSQQSATGYAKNDASPGYEGGSISGYQDASLGYSQAPAESQAQGVNGISLAMQRRSGQNSGLPVHGYAGQTSFNPYSRA